MIPFPMPLCYNVIEICVLRITPANWVTMYINDSVVFIMILPAQFLY